MFLNNFWFLVIGVLWTGYFILEGFDFGVGALLRLVGKDEKGRRVLINTIGPDLGRQRGVGGAAPAPSPSRRSRSGTRRCSPAFYLALLLILVCLIVRGVAFEYRGKGHSDAWRARWDWAILITSWVLALLWGVAFGNIVRGVALDAEHEYVGSFLDLLNPFALVTGLCTLALFLTHGAVYLALKTTLEVRARARSMAMSVGVVAVILMALSVGWQHVAARHHLVADPRCAGGGLAAGGVLLTRAERDGWAFAASALSTALLVLGWFASLYPDVLPSTLDPAFSLNIENAASTPYTLTLMSWIALVFSPVILGYQAWSYWVFRKRISVRQIPESPTQVPVH